MTDSELLEAAAKAAGIEVYGWFSDDEDGEFWGDIGPLDDDVVQWSPLTDDGDALRLAVRLLLATEVFAQFVQVVTQDGDVFRVMSSELDDPYAATRRAIVRAAAEIGRA